MKTERLLRLAVSALVTVGCEAPSRADEDNPCRAASEHIAACEGTEPMPLPSCDTEHAEAIVEVPCGVINGDMKADGLISEVLCSVGQLRHCEVPACDDALPDDFDFAGTTCADLIEHRGCASCDFYRCREAQSVGQCGVEGYYLGFGYEYCMRYRQLTEPSMSPQGQVWSAQVRACLLDAMDGTEDSPDCDALEDAGYATHLDCYQNSGFCDLSLRDHLRLLSTIDASDLDLALIAEISRACD